jgi:hypothetical protein
MKLKTKKMQNEIDWKYLNNSIIVINEILV